MRCGAQPQTPARDERCAGRDSGVRHQQPFETVAMEGREREHDGERDHDTEHDRPEETFLGIERRTAVTIEPGQAKNHRARQPGEDRKLEELSKQHHGVGDQGAADWPARPGRVRTESR